MADFGGTCCWSVRLFAVWLGLVVLAAVGQDFSGTGYDSQSRCYDDRGRPQRCIPEFVNAAFNLRVEATNTCGTNGRTEYCLQTGATGAKKSCEICDANTPHLAHPPDYLTDFNNNDNQTWWQSETMYEGIQYPNKVNLTLHFGKAFDITYVRLKFHTSRPESFAIYKRTREDGPWIPYQYYSATCFSTYKIPVSAYVTKDDETRALCTPEFSDLSPLTGGNVAFSTLEGRPSAYNFENSPVLQEWVTATHIRITLDRQNTFGDEIFGDPKVLKSYYYAISDFAVGGRCKCNGHASECVQAPGSNAPWEEMRVVCRCEHNTAGPDCNECQPFYNDQPWGRATATDVHECKACNCNGRSNKCYFDEELWKQTGHGGHCVDCADNTDGPNCERCRENFYQREDNRCVPCSCDPVGSRSLQCNNQGQCLCKPGVEGHRCDRCAANFYDFTSLGCRPCGCNVAGSTNNSPSCDPVSGICHCKDNVEGQRCERCKPGFFDLQTVNEFGCLPCFCYGHSSVCRSAPGYSTSSIDSTFTRDRERWRAVDYGGNDIPFQYNPIVQNIGVSAPVRDPIYFVAPARYLGDQRASYNQFLHFTFRVGEEGPRATLEDIVLEGSGLTISQPIFGQGNPLPLTRNQEYKFRLHEHSAYGWNPRLGSQDFLSVLSNLTSIKIKATYTPEGVGFLDNVRLETAQRTHVGQDATWIEMCTCPEGYVGQFCESCAPGYRHDPPGGGNFARCVPCNCNGHATYCDPKTGRCICQHNTAGDNCERCAPGFFGNALDGTPNDCEPCPCPNQGACVILPDEEVACLECPEGYAGHKCDLCVDGYFGDPKGRYGPSQPCKKCSCNDNIDTNAVGNCNTTSGICLKCIYNTAGPQCESCHPGYYGNALALPKGDCKACNCYPPGTVLPDTSVFTCSEMIGQCTCKPYVEGRQCDQCDEGFWNIDSGEGCESCKCDPIGSYNHTCNIRSGQCHCRPGVTGQQCDQCVPYYYGFSTEGCKSCDCDPVGSLSLQCEPNGQCECRPNVEGRQCEHCKENKYSKEAGCIDCPPCYNLVQDAVNEHREKLNELADLLDAIEKNPQIVDDIDFENKLAEVQDRVDDLLEDAKKAAGTDGNLIAKLNELKQRLEDVQKSMGQTARRTDEASQIGKLGEENITIAEDVIKRAQEALARARRVLETDGVTALEKARERSDKFGQQSERMSQIAREARQLADEQEKEAAEIEKLADEVLNISTDCYKKAREALETLDQATNGIVELEKEIEETTDFMEQTKRLAEDAKNEADNAYDSALDLYTVTNSVIIPNVDTPGMKQKAADIVDEARRIEADELIDKHEELLDSIESEKKIAEDLLEEAIRQQQMTDELLSDTDAVLDKAKSAVEAGEKTLDEAKKTLETLRAFDDRVQESKTKANDAFKKVPEIEALIHEAENKTKVAEASLSGAEQDAVDSRDIAQEAQKIAEEASKNADAIVSEAEKAKDRASSLKDQADDLAGKVVNTADRMKGFEDQAENDETMAQEALEQANRAKSSAQDASTKVKDALDTVDDILRALDGLDDIDASLLDELERRLELAETELKESDLDTRMVLLRKDREVQNQWIRDYTEEVEQLKKDVANIADIRSSLPDKCFKQVVLEPK